MNWRKKSKNDWGRLGLISNSWQKKTLSDFIYFKNGKKRPSITGDIPVYGGNGILDYTSESNLENAVIIGRVGAYAGSVYYESKKLWVSDNAIAAKAKDSSNIAFIYYLLKNLRLSERQIGTGQPLLTQNILNNIEVYLPSLEEQCKIAEILTTLDARIFENKKINYHLEQVAVSIFDEMFPNVNSGEHTIGEYITPKRGKGLLSKNAVAGSIPVIAGGLQPATYHNTANTKAPVVTISASGANAGYVGLWNTSVWSSDSSFIDSVMTDNVYFWYIMLSKRQQEIYDMQTGSAQPHIYPKHISIMPTIELEQSLVDEYNSRVTPLFETIGANTLQNRKLEETRDSLLPKLMSGEISVTD